MKRVLIVDDDREFRAGLAETLQDLGYQPLEAGGAASVPSMIEQGVDAMILDLRLPGTDGLSLLETLREHPRGQRLPVIVLTAFADADNTIRAMRLGAIDHLTKPVGRADLARVLANAFADGGGAEPSTAAPVAPDAFIGDSPAMRELHKQIGLAAASDATVLILGETGSGKECVARLVHRHSARADGPFVALNCAAIPAELLEAELFGHKRGAFTGAQSDRVGLVRTADGGTLFLDEIGDMPLPMQAKLLRVLETRQITPLGETRALPVDVRVIAATHHALDQHVQAGRFRQDLYFRLNVVTLQVPPLRARPEDIVPLAEHFLRLFRPTSPRLLSAGAKTRLQAHDWPGNVRELRNAMERLSVVFRGRQIQAEDLDFLCEGAAATPARHLQALLDGELPAAIAAIEREMVERALTACGGNRAAAARRLGIHRQQLYKLMQRHRLYGTDDTET
ncbi:sigma-54-dependent transcriptional regulator [Sinimarinibacterium thermocellulolyticum]|uniref:Sigma-54 dependent transcriptional regulator n=1 Tax=Sinimarinibacterium thermocellulolyticum TaxID=3170016 RepID=A0ABV2AAK0_9GAMM